MSNQSAAGEARSETVTLIPQHGRGPRWLFRLSICIATVFSAICLLTILSLCRSEHSLDLLRIRIDDAGVAAEAATVDISVVTLNGDRIRLTQYSPGFWSLPTAPGRSLLIAVQKIEIQSVSTAVPVDSVKVCLGERIYENVAVSRLDPQGRTGQVMLETGYSHPELIWNCRALNFKGLEYVLVTALDQAFRKTLALAIILPLIFMGWHVARPGLQSSDQVSADSETLQITRRQYYLGLLLLAVTAFTARMLLAAAGGQQFFPDERRYAEARTAADCILNGKLFAAAVELHRADHFFFRILSLLPGLVEALAGQHPMIPSAFLALTGAGCLLCTCSIATAVSGSRSCGLFSGACFLASPSMAYFARHFVPYDLALLLGLCAVRVAVAPLTVSRIAVVGVLAVLAFLSYNGYFILSGAAIGLCIAYRAQNPAAAIRNLFIATGVVAGFIGVLMLLDQFWVRSIIHHGIATDSEIAIPLIKQFAAFASTITQGVMGEGSILPIEYLWAADGLLLPLFIAAAAFGLVRLRQALYGHGSTSRTWRAAFLMLLLTAFVYLLLAVFSVVLEKFVVYGRLVRQMVPFACIYCGILLAMTARRGLRVKVGICLLACCVFSNYVVRLLPLFSMISPVALQQIGEDLAKEKNIQILVQNPTYPYPAWRLKHKVIRGALFERPHLINFKPYQYEGFLPEEREYIRQSIVMCRIFKKRSNQSIRLPTNPQP